MDQDEFTDKEREELNLYRSILSEAAQKKTSWSNRLAEYLGMFVAYSAIVFLLYLCWNYSLITLWPQIPEITFVKMAGLWYLVSVFLKRS